jgi:hypothetical protein
MQDSILPGIDFDAKLAAFHHRRASTRTRGIHQSDVIHYILERYDPKRFGGRGPIDPALAHSGFLWEDVLSWGFGRQFGDAQMEMELDSILMTLDGFNVPDWRVREFKCTKISARNPFTSSKFWHWQLQVAGYCTVMDTLEAEMYVLFVNGSYEEAGGRFGKTVVRPRLWRFTARERRENWETILRARDHMVRDKAWMKARGVAA